MRLKGKVALISGAARGMGATEARLFAKEGAKVVLTDVLEKEGTKVAAEIAENGGDAIFVRMDVTKEEDWKRAVQTTVQKYGKVDILINNAGIWKTGAVEDTTAQLWDQVMDVNAKGVFLGTKLVIPEMRKAGGGSIINISSVAGLMGAGTGAAYGASKGAVRLLTKATAVQYGKEKIRCNSIHPGPIDTAMLSQLIAEGAGGSMTDEMMRAMVPLGRIGRPEEVATCALFLASDESSYVTGSELVVDGGLFAT
ncbi:MAG: glucose 1-dehydrogenase [Dehalococcoidia bacterium]|nr:glucose 1-dehydrogenase [Dehalococcoidia bacterium]